MITNAFPMQFLRIHTCKTRLTKSMYYIKHLNTLNTDGIEFHEIRQIQKFEAQSEHLSINVLYYDCDDKYIAPLYVSKRETGSITLIF